MTHPFQVAIREAWVVQAIATYEAAGPKTIEEFAHLNIDLFGPALLDRSITTTDVSGMLIALHCLWKFWAHGAQSLELTESLALALAKTDPGDIEWELPYDGFWIGFGGAQFAKLTDEFVQATDDIIHVDSVDALNEGFDETSVRVYDQSGYVGDYDAPGCYVSKVESADGVFEVNIHAIDPSKGITSGVQLMTGKNPTSPLGRLLKNLCLYLSTPEAKIKPVHDRSAKNKERLADTLKKLPFPSRFEGLAPWLAKKTKPSVTRVGGQNELGESTHAGGGGLKGAHWVRGHWRQQWYGSAEARAQRPKRIRPHRRGGNPEEGLRTYEVQS